MTPLDPHPNSPRWIFYPEIIYGTLLALNFCCRLAVSDPPHTHTHTAYTHTYSMHTHTHTHTASLRAGPTTTTTIFEFISRGPIFRFWGTPGWRTKCPFYTMEHRETTKIFHLVCHQMPIWCGIRCKTFLENYCPHRNDYKLNSWQIEKCNCKCNFAKWIPLEIPRCNCNQRAFPRNCYISRESIRLGIKKCNCNCNLQKINSRKQK